MPPGLARNPSAATPRHDRPAAARGAGGRHPQGRAAIALFENMHQVARQPIAHINHCGSQAALTEQLPKFKTWFDN